MSRCTNGLEALSTVNASVTQAVDPAELAEWIRDGNLSDGRASLAISVFFLEVPLETQVRFLAHFSLTEVAAVRTARRTIGPTTPIPLESRFKW